MGLYGADTVWAQETDAIGVIGIDISHRNCGILDDMTHICAHCNNSFRGQSGNQNKYCSQKCYQEVKIALLGRKKTKAEINAAYRQRNIERIRQSSRDYYYRTHRNQKDRRLQTHYGVSMEWYDAQLAAQNGLCAVCNRPEIAIHKRTGKLFGLAVDHDHETGVARQLLCGHCNSILGAIEKHKDTVLKLLEYLDRHGKPNFLDQ